MPGVELAALKIDECAADALVRVVIPRCGIRRRAAEKANRRSAVRPESKVATVNRVQAGRPWQVEAANTSDPAAIGIVIGQADVVRAVKEVLQSRLGVGGS